MSKFFFLFLCIIAILSKNNLEAIPTFARNLGLDCSTCHTAYPQLTEFGKLFLEAAGEMLIQQDYGAMTMTPDPVSGRVTMLPIIKPFSIDSVGPVPRRERELRIHALEEADIFLGGSVGKFFYFVHVDGNVENDFSVQVDEGFIAYRFCKNLNFFGGYSTPFKLDANDTVDHNNALFRQWKAADYVPGTSQMIGAQWKCGKFYGIVAWHGDDDQFEGIDPKNVSLRGSYDIGHQTFGTYFSYGKHFNEDLGRSSGYFVLSGIDSHLRFDNDKVNIMMLLGFRGGRDRKLDFDFSIEVNKIYTFENKASDSNGKKNKCAKNINKCNKQHYFTTFIPIANIDFFQDRTLSPGTWVKGSGGVAFYFNPAVRIFPQVIYTFLAPSEFKHREFKALIEVDIGF